MSKRAVFTGTFDPFHRGHALQLERAYTAKPYDSVVIAVIGHNPKKPHAIPFEHRAELARLTLGSFELPFTWSVEAIIGIDPAGLKAFTAKHTQPSVEWCRIIGSDSFIEFVHDAELRPVLELFDYTITLRPQNTMSEVQAALQYLRGEDGGAFNPTIVPLEDEYKSMRDISARNVRVQPEQSAQAGLLVPDAIAYMREHHLYAFGSPNTSV